MATKKEIDAMIERQLMKMIGPEGDYTLGMEEIRGNTYKVWKKGPQTLNQFFSFSCDKNAKSEFVIYNNERYTYAHVYNRASAVAKELKSILEKGDRAAIAMRNLPEFVVAFMSITALGCVCVPVNGWWTPDEMEYGMCDSGTSVAFVDEPRLARFAAITNFPKKLRVIYCVRTTAAAVADAKKKFQEKGVDVELRMFDDILGRHPVEANQPLPSLSFPTAADDNAIIMYTSGTTANPKGVVLTHRGVLSAVRMLGLFVELGAALTPPPPTPKPRPAIICTVPLFHATGSHAIFLASFLGDGRKLILMDKWNATKALEIIEKEKVNSFTGVPTMAYELINHPDLDKYDTSSLESLGGGGAPTPPKQVKSVSKKFKNAKPSQGYGLTETNAITCLNSADNYEARPTSCGKAVLNVDVKVVDVDDVTRTLPPNTPGELLIRGATVMKEYWNNPTATAEAITPDGWFRSGDLAKIDEEGYVYILDRVKQIIIRGGENISCSTVEAAVYEHPAVVEAAAIGVPHERLGEEVGVAIVVRPSSSPPSLSDIQQICNGKIASFMIPTKLFIWPHSQLPRGATGKIQKRDILAAVKAKL